MDLNEGLLLSDDSLLGDVDSIEELTDILVAGEAGLVDEGSRAGDELDVVSDELDLVLGGGAGSCDSVEHLDLADELLSEEVTDLNSLVGVGNVDVDGEVVVDETHLVGVSLWR